MKHPLTPDAPYSFIADDLAIGGITAYGETDVRFDLYVQVAYEITDQDPGDQYRHRGSPVLQFRLDDTADSQIVLRQASEVFRAVEVVKQARARGRRVLVTCAQGRNRSGIVAAEYLIQCGNKPADVVRKIQERRTGALTNTTFVAWLHRPRAR